VRYRCRVETRDSLSGWGIRLIIGSDQDDTAPAATKKKKVRQKTAKVSHASWNQRQGRDTHGESGIRSLMDIKRSSMSAVFFVRVSRPFKLGVVINGFAVRTYELAESIGIGILVDGR
jgi:hypothetical protein